MILIYVKTLSQIKIFIFYFSHPNFFLFFNPPTQGRLNKNIFLVCNFSKWFEGFEGWINVDLLMLTDVNCNFCWLRSEPNTINLYYNDIIFIFRTLFSTGFLSRWILHKKYVYFFFLSHFTERSAEMSEKELFSRFKIYCCNLIF